MYLPLPIVSSPVGSTLAWLHIRILHHLALALPLSLTHRYILIYVLPHACLIVRT
jgi:hypothetical protein